ncbi:MAG: (5-formylfuran-3-yl)methyl phosphate synthase [Aureliella sp.]
MSTSIPSYPVFQPRQGHFPSVGPRLLVSIRNANEARMARTAGVDWIDLKNPDVGSLGAADEQTSAEVADQLCHFSDSEGSASCLSSAAVGELRDAPLAAARYLAKHFPLLKVGLSGLRERADWSTALVDFAGRLQSFGANLVPVIYADHELCSAPNPYQVIEAAAQCNELMTSLHSATHRTIMTEAASQYLLVDTFTKDGRRLLDWIDLPELEAIIEIAAQAGRHVVLAGSLARQDLPHLWSLPVIAIAVRGAVCAGDRRSEVCAQKLQQWVELFRNR